MAVGEETVLDAPVTPAPVFAYRALRAVIWGEDKTPERQPQITQNVLAKDLINIPGMRAPVEFSPGQKRKHTMLTHPSPTKSILRTPGAHTPRRAMLKDLNVKFKDLRKSVSPELVHKQPPKPQSSVAEIGKENIDVARESKAIATNTASTALPAKLSDMTLNPNQTTKTTTARAASMPAQSITSARMDSIVAFDAEAYMRSTEIEMKKLIKYGQKMREYAKKQEQENNQLRQMLEETRKENERLQRQIEIKTSERMSTEIVDSDNGRKVKNSVRSQSASAFHNTKSSKAKLHETGPGNADFLFDLMGPPQKQISQAPQTRNTTNAKRSHQQQPDLVPTAIPTPPIRPQQSSPSPSKRPRRSDRIENHQSQDEPLRSITINSVGSKRLAPDRLAAARARVREKAELRKTSAELGGGYGGDGTEDMKVDSDKDKVRERESNVDPSLVDWADL